MQPDNNPIGAAVTSSPNYDIYKLTYQWSIYHSDKVELSAGIGIHLTDINIELDATVLGDSVSTSRAKSLLPLPVVSFRIGYDVTPKVHWFAQSEVFSIEVDDLDGTYSDLLLNIEYRATQHLGFGIGLGTNSLKVVEETNRYRFDFYNRVTGNNLYMSGYF